MLIKKSAKLSQLFTNPTIDRAQKKQYLDSLFTPTAHSEIFKNFLCLLAENGRLGCFEAICGVYEEMIRERENKLNIVLTSAHALEPSMLKRLESLIRQKFIKPNQTATFAHRIEPGIMGGFIVEIGDKTVDLSIGPQISQLQKEISLV